MSRPDRAWRRRVSRGFTVWAWGAFAAVVVGSILTLPFVVWGTVAAAFVALALIRPHPAEREPIEVACPLRGTWTVVHSPADAVPSHGVRGYAQSYAIDIIRPRPPGTAPTYPVLGGFERPEGFASFGEPMRAAAAGTVVRVLDARRDHLSRTSWLAFAYMFVIDGLRDFGGIGAVIGNHVVIDHGEGVFSLYAHMRRRSATVRKGDRVAAGDVIGEVGNSGNTSEPHLHFQLMDRAHPLSAGGLPFRFVGIGQPEGATDPSWSRKPAQAEIVPGLPANFQQFEA